MGNIGRELGINIYLLMQKAGISHEKLARQLNCSYRDVCRILEGKSLVTPTEIQEIANFFGKTKQDLLYYEPDEMTPELWYIEEFSNKDNLDMILDLIDGYVELKEAI